MNKSYRILIVCGILSSIIYILTDLITGLITPNYSFYDQTVSELSAIGAPTRFIWQIITFVYNPLLIAFGVGIQKIAQINQKQSLKFTGILLVLWGLLGFVWLFFPMHLRGSIGSVGDTAHLIMTGLTVILMIILIAVGSNVYNHGFRLYSFFTLIIMAFFGFLTSRHASNVAANLPTPMMGITERVCSYSPLIWVIFLTLILMRSDLKKDKTV